MGPLAIPPSKTSGCLIRGIVTLLKRQMVLCNRTYSLTTSGCFCRNIFGLTESTSPVAISHLILDNYVNEYAYEYDIFVDSRMKVIYANNNLLSIHKLFIVIR